MPGGRLDVMSFNCDAVNELAPHELGITYWFVDQPTGPGSLSVRLDGRRDGVTGRPGPHDQFTFTATVDEVVAGAGPIALTSRIDGLTPGTWTVTATPERPRPARRATVRKASSRRDSVTTASGSTTFAPFARVRAPGVRLGAWPALVGLGAVIAVALQMWLADQADLRAGRLLLFTIVASLVGVVGGKVHYRVTHRGGQMTILTMGMSIQGFVLACMTTLVVASALTGMAIGTVLGIS